MKTDQVISQFLLASSAAPVQQTKGAVHTTINQTARKNTVHSAVLLPIVSVHDRAHLLFCKRSNILNSHPSQICFPGGKVEQQDANIINTALRETEEEIGLSITESQVLGTLPLLSTLTGYQITPVVAKVHQHAKWLGQSAEVQHTFVLPLKQLKAQQNWQTFNFIHKGESVSLEGFMTPHGLLWGATAKIVKQFIQLV